MHLVARIAGALVVLGFLAFGLQPHPADAGAKQRAKHSAPAWYARRLPTLRVIGGAAWFGDTATDPSQQDAPALDLTSLPLGDPSPYEEELGRAQTAALKALSTLRSGVVEIRNGAVSLQGFSNELGREEVQAALRKALPASHRLVRIDVAPVATEPYHFAAVRKEATFSGSWLNQSDSIELTGFAPDEKSRHRLLATAQSLQPDLVILDRMQISPKAPARFVDAAVSALSQLRQFRSGFVYLSRNRLDILGSVDGARRSVQSVCRQALTRMPRGYACGFVHVDGDEEVIARKGGKGGMGMGRGRRTTTISDSSSPLPPIRPTAKTTISDPGKPLPPVPTKGKTTPASLDEELNKRTVDLYFSTNRKLNVAQSEAFSDSDITNVRDQLRFGVVRVHIPKDPKRKIGTIPLPGGFSLWPFGRVELDPDKHFYVRGRQTLTREQFSEYVRQIKPTDALVLVHGYNNSFDDSAFRLAQIVWDLGYSGLPVLFSWPSQARPLAYLTDRELAYGSRAQFAELLEFLNKKLGLQKIHVIAHSMGNVIAMEALAGFANTSDPVRIAEFIMAAPDVETTQFVDQIPLLRKITGGLTLYASANDWALTFSRQFVSGMSRAGEIVGNQEPTVVAGLETIDVSAVGSDALGLNHNTFASNRSVVDDLKLLLTMSMRSPRLGQIRGVPDKPDSPRYWRYAD